MSLYDGNHYRATVLRWVDGDTVWLRVDLGQRTCREDSYRFHGINAPETKRYSGVSDEEVEAGRTLTALLNTAYPPESTFWVRTLLDPGKYGRYLVDVFVDKTLHGDESPMLHLNQHLLDLGLVVPYGFKWAERNSL